MISSNVTEALNQQLNEEFYSSYIYLSMAAFFESKNLVGMANWMKIQTQEEYAHAIKFYDFINSTGQKVVLKEIKAPQVDWDTPQAVFETTLEHEKYITDCINKLARLADDENDYATKNFLNWFIDEQVEEVATVDDILQRFKLIGDDKPGLFWLDKELAERQTTPQAQ